MLTSTLMLKVCKMCATCQAFAKGWMPACATRLGFYSACVVGALRMHAWCVACLQQDSWFNTLKLQLPAGAGYEIQMRYGRCVASLTVAVVVPLCQDSNSQQQVGLQSCRRPSGVLMPAASESCAQQTTCLSVHLPAASAGQLAQHWATAWPHKLRASGCWHSSVTEASRYVAGCTSMLWQQPGFCSKTGADLPADPMAYYAALL